MNPPIPPSTLWHERSEQLERNVRRVRDGLGQHVEPQHRALAGKLRHTLGELDAELAALKASSDGPGRWLALSNAHAVADGAFAAMLELFGGAFLAGSLAEGEQPLDGGLSVHAERWLNQLRQNLGLDRELTVVVGRGPLLERELGAVYVPFLSLDLWSLPLLARAVGLLAAGAEDTRLTAAIDGLAPELRALPPGGPAARPEGWERRYLQHLCADMLATLMLGPVYAITVFALDLDYAEPEQYGCEEATGGGQARQGPLPGAAQRAAAILATLRLIDEAREPASSRPLYTAIAEQVEGLWGAAPELLARAREAFRPWHEALYAAFGADSTWRERREAAGRNWQRARSWYEELRRAGQSAQRAMPEHPDRLTEVLTLMWLCRAADPEQGATLPRFAEGLLAGEAHRLRLSAGGGGAALVPRVRGEQLELRLRRLERLLKDGRIPRERRAAVSGRFYRMVSEQLYRLERGAALGQPPAATTWGNLAALEAGAQPLLHEAQEFLGGLFVHQRGLDCELTTCDEQDGPSMCALADRLLADYAERTGVNWSAGTVPGRGSFVESTTDIIRVDFLDLSVWNLPVMAHEFGHLAAPKTPGFAAYRHAVTVAATAGLSGDAAKDRGDQLRAYVEEFFADCFATYCTGPAFACCAVLNLFDPVKAFTPFAAHPSHQERVDLILQTLGLMGAKTRCADFPGGRYELVVDLLRGSWDTAVAEARATASAERREQVSQWGEQLYTMIDTYFRLGAGYAPERWAWAQAVAGSPALLQLSPAQLQQRAADAGIGELLLDDILNVLWWARVNPYGKRPDIASLTGLAHALTRAFERR